MHKTAKLHLFIYYVYPNVDHRCLVTSENYWQRVNFRAQLHTVLLVHAGRGALSLNFYPLRINCDKLQTKNPRELFVTFI